MNLEGRFRSGFGTIFDLLLRKFLPFPALEVATAFGLCLLYLGTVQASGLPEAIFMGLATGRQQAALSLEKRLSWRG